MQVIDWDAILERSLDVNGNINPSKLSILDKSRISDNLPYSCKGLAEKLFVLANGITSHPICHQCKKTPVLFNSGLFEYRRFCSKSCSSAHSKLSGTAKQRASNRKPPNQKHLTSIASVVDVVLGGARPNGNLTAQYKETFNASVINQIFQATVFCTSESFLDRIKIINDRLTEKDMMCYCGNHALYGKSFCSVKCSNSNLNKINKTKETTLKSFGVVTTLMLEKNKVRSKHEIQKKALRQRNFYRTHDDILEDISSNNTKLEISKITKIPYQTLCAHLRLKGFQHKKSTRRSSYEDEIIRFVESLGKQTTSNSRQLITPYEIDVFVESSNLAIEFDGDYWHSCNSREDIKHRISLNRRKMEKLETSGISKWLFINEYLYKQPSKRRIYENMIKNALNVNSTIYARKCNLHKITDFPKHTIFHFLENNHIQGKCGYTNGYCLSHDGELVSVMLFARPRFSSTYQWEIMRLCSLGGTTIVGGASRMFKAFIREYNPSSILSFGDKRWTNKTNNVYSHLGFNQVDYNTLGYVWYYRNQTFSRSQLQKHKLHKILPNFKNNLTAVDNLLYTGYRQLFDYGQLKYVWNRPPDNSRSTTK